MTYESWDRVGEEIESLVNKVEGILDAAKVDVDSLFDADKRTINNLEAKKIYETAPLCCCPDGAQCPRCELRDAVRPPHFKELADWSMCDRHRRIMEESQAEDDAADRADFEYQALKDDQLEEKFGEY